MLSIVATPIGNLEDITLRALKVLKECDVILCEDTRHTKILLNRYEINKTLISYHSHSSGFKLKKIAELFTKKKKVCLVSDAGTPGISDPGYKVIQLALEHNIKIEAIPGPAAFLTALQASGATMNQFIYLGFLPLKKGRQKLWQELVLEKRTIVFYESPYRVLKTLNDIKKYFGDDKYVIIARELTKMHEEYLRKSVTELIEHFSNNKPRGEFVFIIPFK